MRAKHFKLAFLSIFYADVDVQFFGLKYEKLIHAFYNQPNSISNKYRFYMFRCFYTVYVSQAFI